MQNKSQRPRTADDSDRVAKWLRRWTANPIRSPCVATNPFPVGIFFPTGERKQHMQEKNCKRNRKRYIAEEITQTLNFVTGWPSG